MRVDRPGLGRLRGLLQLRPLRPLGTRPPGRERGRMCLLRPVASVSGARTPGGRASTGRVVEQEGSAMATVTVSRQISAPIEEIFKVFTDLSHASERVSGIKKLEVLTS